MKLKNRGNSTVTFGSKSKNKNKVKKIQKQKSKKLKRPKIIKIITKKKSNPS